MKRIAINLPNCAAAAMALCITLALPTPARADSPFANGTYVILPVSGPAVVLEAAGAGTTSGTVVDLGLKLKSPEKQWILTDTGGGKYLIQPANAPTLALTDIGAASADGSPVDVETSKKDATQLWSFTKVGDGIYNITPQSANSTGLDDFGGGNAPGAKVDVWTDDPTDEHLQWRIKPVSDDLFKSSLADGTYTITPHDGTAIVLECAGGATDPSTAIQGAAPTKADSQKWIVASAGNGFVTIVSAKAKTMAVTVTGGASATQTPLILQPLKAGDQSQLWRVIEMGGDGKGQYLLSPGCAPKEAIDNPGGAKDPGTPMWIWDMDPGNTHQWWIFNPAK